MLFITYGLGRAFTVSIMLCGVNPWMIIPIVVAVFMLILVYKKSAPALAESMIMDSVVRGPIHQIFTTVIGGLVSIRAYKKLSFFEASYLIQNAKSANVTFSYYTAGRYLGIRFDMVSIFVQTFAVLMVIFFRGSIDPKLLAFSLQNLSDSVVFFAITVRMSADFQTFMTSPQAMV